MLLEFFNIKTTVREKVAHIEKENAKMGPEMRLLDRVPDVIWKKRCSIWIEQGHVHGIQLHILSMPNAPLTI
jgi:hypothetical protein